MMENWEKALAEHEKSCEQRYGEVQATIARLEGKFSVSMWVLGYIALALSGNLVINMWIITKLLT